MPYQSEQDRKLYITAKHATIALAIAGVFFLWGVVQFAILLTQDAPIQADPKSAVLQAGHRAEPTVLAIPSSGPACDLAEKLAEQIAQDAPAKAEFLAKTGCANNGARMDPRLTVYYVPMVAAALLQSLDPACSSYAEYLADIRDGDYSAEIKVNGLIRMAEAAQTEQCLFAQATQVVAEPLSVPDLVAPALSVMPAAEPVSLDTGSVAAEPTSLADPH